MEKSLRTNFVLRILRRKSFGSVNLAVKFGNNLIVQAQGSSFYVKLKQKINNGITLEEIF